MICCSVNRDRFIVRLPRWDGLYPNLEEIQGLTSDCTKSPHLLVNFIRKMIANSIVTAPKSDQTSEYNGCEHYSLVNKRAGDP